LSFWSSLKLDLGDRFGLFLCFEFGLFLCFEFGLFLFLCFEFGLFLCPRRVCFSLEFGFFFCSGVFLRFGYCCLAYGSDCINNVFYRGVDCGEGDFSSFIGLLYFFQGFVRLNDVVSAGGSVGCCLGLANCDGQDSVSALGLL
jgi:hypothetical protein